ncbi:MAG: NAD(P)/FAD-dependent oxidoreductase [Actinomycetota bacterium]|nr:NAD(P)/FAD-dependent oxidoreductase [Actinomycetota bacterium]MDQ2980734.1 NAD(P)/FAD-dependent oxidoreductase [Actinomycetota bacterium]
MKQFDVVIVGGGTAGITAALAARSVGVRVALVEREPRLGGDCTFYGCVPSKALLEIAKVVNDARRAAAEGIFADAPIINFGKIAARRRRIVEEVAADERDERFERAGIALIRGQARFLSAFELEVDGERVGSKTFVVATGSEPAVPSLAGIDQVPYLTNRTIFDLERLPSRLLVLGGGATGLELAQAFRRFGSEVVVVEILERLLPRDEPEAGRVLAEVLRGEGVDLRLGAKAVGVTTDGAGLVLSLEQEELRSDALLVAAGRSGSVEGLGLEALGVTLDGGYVKINGRGRTSVANIFAAGDVTGGLQFTHVAAHEGRVAGLNAAGKRAKIDERVAPWVTFTDPEIAHVGLTEEEARERHEGIEVVSYPMSRVDRARIEQRPFGFVKLVTARRRVLGRLGGGELVGAQIVGPHAGELIQECALAMQTRCFAGRLTQTIHPYPATTLAVQQAAAQLFPLGRVLVESD